MKEELSNFFEAKVVALFGFSPNPDNLMRNIVMNCRNWGFTGKLYGISPKPGENDGVKIYSSLKELPEKPELAVVLTRANVVPEILLECAKNNLRHIAISSGGFEESSSGKELAEKVKIISREKGLFIVGPNGIATANNKTGLSLSFMPLKRPPVGKIAFITQSGGVGTTLTEKMNNEYVALGKFVSLGNKTLLDEVDFLEYFANDPETEVICIYLEDMRRGREFLDVAKRVTKPVIVYKANVTPYGLASAASHTAALSNEDDILDSALKQANVLRVRSLSAMITLAKCFNLPAMKGNNLLIISPSGGYAVILSDLAYQYGFELPPLPREIVEKYSQRRRSGIIEFKNPVDFGDIYSAEVQRNFLRECLANDIYDGMLLAYVYRDPEMLKQYPTLSQLQRDLIAEFVEAIELIKKPIGFVFSVPFKVRSEILAKCPYPLFDTPEDAAFYIAKLRDYYKRKKNLIVAEN